jgi:signal transduction histidine kinase
MSKIEAGSLELYVEDGIDLNVELPALIATAQQLLEDKPVTILPEIETDLPPLTGDRQRINQIMLNLVSNACKFTEEGHITIGARHQDGEILLFVKDTGPGIAPEDHEAIFESFRQTEAGLRQGKGTGLGLPISRRLAEAHGGRIWLESARHQGATFYVALPIKPEHLVPTQTP